MSPEYARQLCDTMRPTDGGHFPFAMMITAKYSAVILRDGVPIVGIGAQEKRPGHFNLWLVATDDLSAVRFTLVKTIRKMLAQRLPDNLKTLRLAPISSISASYRWTAFLRDLCRRPELVKD
jgi:hypothetical protein